MNDRATKKQIIANRLREARKLAGLSQGQVAKMMGLHRPTISEIEAGNRNVTATELTLFGEIYDVSVAWLSGEGAEKLDPEDDRVQLAFRELQKLKPNDLDKLLRALAALRGPLEEK
jgi:transcriptional regulator with XRE-family HTH domain